MTKAQFLEKRGCLSSFSNMFGHDHSTPTPQYDAFYGYNEVESTIKDHAPGTILRARAIKVRSFVGIKGSEMKAWHLAYTTTGPLGPEVTVCTVIVPPNAGKRDKIVVQCPKTDSANAYARTSWVLRKGNGDLYSAASEQIFMAPFLDRGYIVVVPDYEGQRDSFGCGVVSGKATLDAIRAALAFKGFQLAPRKEIKVVIWGYSGGAIASAWAAQYLQSYAPDLKTTIVGISFGGLSPNLLACALKINGGVSAGLTLGIIQGLANAYPKLQTWLDASLTKKGKEAFQVVKTKPFGTIMRQTALKDVLNLTKRPVKYWIMDTNPVLESTPLKVVQQNNMLDVFEAANKDAKLVPKVPLYIYHGIDDNICPIAPVDTLVSTWKRNGAPINYVRINVLHHVGVIFANHSENVEWMQDRLEGKPLTNRGDGNGVARSIADKASCASLKHERAEQLQDFFDKVFDKTDKSYFF